VRKFSGAVSADAEAVKGILVTTSGLSEEARKFAQSVGVELTDKERPKAILAENEIWGVAVHFTYRLN
jgi:restriction endonuclease Mrr